MPFPSTRMRRLRASAGLRDLLRETHLRAGQLILPLFVSETKSTMEAGPGGRLGREPIPTMPGVDRLSLATAVEEAEEASALGVGAVMLFGLPTEKDDVGSQAWAEDGIVQKAVAEIKAAVDGLAAITDVCLCEYTSHGHCGVFKGDPTSERDADIDNDATIELLGKIAVSHVSAGADVVAPSDMMDGRVARIRESLDGAGFGEAPIFAYSVKLASSFYGPFRDAVDCAPAFGDRRSHQMDPANGWEAVREALLDVEEGADALVVKPALAYGDLISAVKRETQLPVVAYNVGGEYAMVKAAAASGFLDERSTVLEILTSLSRAGADAIVTYHAKDAARWLSEAG